MENFFIFWRELFHCFHEKLFSVLLWSLCSCSAHFWCEHIDNNVWTPQIVFFFCQTLWWWPQYVQVWVLLYICILYFWFHVVFCLRVLYPNAIWWQCSPSISSIWTGGYPFILSLTNLKCSVGRYFFIHRESLDFSPNSSHDLVAIIKDSVLPMLILQ